MAKYIGMDGKDTPLEIEFEIDSQVIKGIVLVSDPPAGAHKVVNIYLTKDGCRSDLTEVLAATDKIVDIRWDWRDHRRVWALTDIMNLYLSLDYGENWNLIVNFRTSLSEAAAIGRSIGLPASYGNDDCWVWGGDGAGLPLIAFFQGQGGVVRVPLGGELSSDGTGANALAAIVDAVDLGSGAAIILEQYDASDSGLRSIYYNPVNAASPADWVHATGLTASMTVDGVYVVTGAARDTFHFGFADRDVWHMTSDGPHPAVVKTADVLASGFTPNRCLAMGDVANGPATARAYIVAVEDGGATGGLVKSTDELESTGDFRPAGGSIGTTWPASALGKDIVMGMPAIPLPAGGSLLATGIDVSPREVSQLLADGWTDPVQLPGSVTGSDPVPICITPSLWFVINGDNGEEADGWGAGARTKDGGISWGVTPLPADGGLDDGGIVHIAADAGGRLWMCGQDTTDLSFTKSLIYYSDDEGDTWTQVFANGTGSSPQIRRIWRVITHPTDQNIIAALSFKRDSVASGYTHYSTDRGASWNTNSDVKTKLGQQGVMHTYSAVMLDTPSGTPRIIAQGPFNTSGSVPWWTLRSDDFGASWPTIGTTKAGVADRNMGLYVRGTTVAFIQKDPDPAPDVHHLFLSKNSGQSVSEKSLPVELEALVDDGLTVKAFAFSPETDSLYYKVAENTRKIWRLSPVSGAGVWTDLTLNYPHGTD